MSKGQIAIAELQKRVGRVDPVTGFRIIDDLLAEQQEHLENFEQLLCGMAWDKGALVAAAQGLWLEGAFVEGDFALECLQDVEVLLALKSPGINATELPVEEPRRIIQ